MLVALGLGEGRLGLRQCDARVTVIDPHQHIAFADGLRVADAHFGHLSCDHRGDLGGIGADIGVVRGDVVAAHQRIPAAKADRRQQHGAGDAG